VTPDIKLPTALDPEQFGESSSPSALPWDEIRGTLFQKTPVINDKVIAGLNKSYNERLKSDAALERFVKETEDTRKNLQDTRISLNETTRKKEMEEAEKRAASAKLNTKIAGKESERTSDLQNMSDEYLREGLFVLGDLIVTKIG
jgi:carboxyl-terminal processing protease